MSFVALRKLFQSNLLLGCVALLAGALAAWLGARQLQVRTASMERQISARYATTPYIVASRDLPRGQLIDASMLAVRALPRTFAPPDALPPDGATALIGSRSAIAIRRGTPVVAAALAREATRERMSELLPDGMRALSIHVDTVNSLSGRLEAGDVVDIYYSRPRGSEAVLLPLMQRVQVLATGDMTRPELESRSGDVAADFSTVTLLVAAPDAQRIVLAEQTGRLTLSLRRPSDQQVAQSLAVDSSQLLRPARAVDRRDQPAEGPVELLVGGQGFSPSRSWLKPGEGA